VSSPAAMPVAIPVKTIEAQNFRAPGVTSVGGMLL
jgi:hypothetical protein